MKRHLAAVSVIFALSLVSGSEAQAKPIALVCERNGDIIPLEIDLEAKTAKFSGAQADVFLLDEQGDEITIGFNDGPHQGSYYLRRSSGILKVGPKNYVCRVVEGKVF